LRADDEGKIKVCHNPGCSFRKVLPGLFFLEEEEKMSKRVGFVGIIIEDRKKAAHAVNEILSEHAEIIVARVGVPYRERGCSVITLIVDATTDELGALTGRLGALDGVTVKSGLTKQSPS